MVMVGNSSAVVATRVSEDKRGPKIADDLKTVSIARMVEFSDPNERRNGRNKK